ncbi:MAG: SulP family inorganic anion transporter [Chloroherpetonaceae bacterium]|nr:SulP family inorganic anion transporter [Chloroherpetonaceae bacterium]MDW8438455.1 SulP family inorganic anion transporter [Chloroherpetonaceae bacterium]
MTKADSSLQSGVLPNLRYDLPASLVVFFVAIPLCLGIALASNAPLFSGLVAGVVGGIVVGILSGSQLSVTGPAAGLTVIVATSIEKLGSFEVFLLAVVLAGILQLVLGYLRAGIIGNYFPNSVITGMLTAIGIVIILKQIPHAVGWDKDYEGNISFLSEDGNTFTTLFHAAKAVEPVAILIAIVSIALLAFWETPRIKKHKVLKLVPAPLLAVILGVLINELFKLYAPELALKGDDGHLVKLPDVPIDELPSHLILPDFSALARKDVYIVAVTLALVASLETLLTVEAVDKLDPFKRISDMHRELKAQGVGNIISGLLGGLPMTAVIVRSSANVYADARTRVSTISHGVLLLFSVLFIPEILNLIPLASLACILIMVGYKLAHYSLFVRMYEAGRDVFLPFIVTVVAVIFTDLLIGIAIGSLVGLFFVLRANHHSATILVSEGNMYLLKFNKDMSFVNKAELKDALSRVPDNVRLYIDGTRSMFIDHDIYDIINDFQSSAALRGITVELKNFHGKKLPIFNVSSIATPITALSTKKEDNNERPTNDRRQSDSVAPVQRHGNGRLQETSARQ